MCIFSKFHLSSFLNFSFYYSSYSRGHYPWIPVTSTPWQINMSTSDQYNDPHKAHSHVTPYLCLHPPSQVGWKLQLFLTHFSSHLLELTRILRTSSLLPSSHLEQTSHFTLFGSFVISRGFPNLFHTFSPPFHLEKIQACEYYPFFSVIFTRRKIQNIACASM